MLYRKRLNMEKKKAIPSHRYKVLYVANEPYNELKRASDATGISMGKILAKVVENASKAGWIDDMIEMVGVAK